MTSSKDPFEYIESGKAKLEAKDYKGAIDDFNKAVEITPNDREIVLTVVKLYGLALSRADEDLKADREIVHAAVKSHGNSLMHANTYFMRTKGP